MRRVRKIYAERREVFSEQFEKSLGHRFRLDIADAGLHALAWFRSEKDVAIVQRAAPKLGVKISFLSFFCIEAKLPPALVLGFAAWTPAQIREGLGRIARPLDRRAIPSTITSMSRRDR